MKILVVDDHEATVTFMRLAFTSAGYAVRTATSVPDALKQLSQDPGDVVLTDLTLGGGGGGLELARSLRADGLTRSVGILAVSGVSAPDVLQATVDSGFDGFVSKPVDLASLLERVRQLGEVVSERRSVPETQPKTSFPRQLR